MYVEISSVSSFLWGLLGVLPVLAYPSGWETENGHNTAENKVYNALRAAAETIKKEIVQLAKELFGDEFPQTEYFTRHGNQMIVIQADGICYYPYFTLDGIEVRYDRGSSGPAFVLLPTGIFTFKQIGSKQPGEEYTKTLPRIETSSEINPHLYCIIGEKVITVLNRAAENRKQRKEAEVIELIDGLTTQIAASRPA